MEESKKDQVIELMKRSLEQYANPEFWGKLYGGYQHDERLWLGIGPGRLLAEETLKQVNKESGR